MDTKMYKSLRESFKCFFLGRMGKKMIDSEIITTPLCGSFSQLGSLTAAIVVDTVTLGMHRKAYI